jgi:hypothetical protein
MGKVASLGEEAVLADLGRVGEVAARVGRVRSLAFLSSLRGCSSLVSQDLIIDVLIRQHGFPQY